MLVNDLSELERDALTELVNIAVSGAASRLRAMVGSQVGLSVPIIEVLGAARRRSPWRPSVANS
ncbi:hypothetical protein BH10PSE3_BH10PSE3_04260 [soil metagenome]